MTTATTNATNTPAAAAGTANDATRTEADFAIKILLDGECTLCKREGEWLKKRDAKLNGSGRLAFEDIADPEFDAGKYGRTQDEVMAEIHGVLPDGTVITGVEVFRRAYREIKLGWLIGWTAWPPFRGFANAAYRWFARNRIRMSNLVAPLFGEPKRKPLNCDTGRCRV
ncbi:MAG: DUF393 domain-containing protein [Planctomycetota bacterium]